MSTWLVTGGSGFIGRHVLDALATGPAADDCVVALGRRPPRVVRGIFVTANLESADETAAIVSAIRPRYLIHAAGLTPPAAAEDLYRANTLATVHLLEALRLSGHRCRVVLVGSAAELGPVPVDRLPIAEDEPCHPADAYGLSKLLATTAGLAGHPPVEVVVARVFNPIGAGLPDSQALGRFASILAQSVTESIRLEVGNLESRRDFIDVRDVAQALLSLALRGRAGSIYHVGTGQSRRVGDGLESLLQWSNRRVEVVIRPSLSSGPSDSRADIRKIVAETGWTPRIRWEQSLLDLWEAVLATVGRH